MKRAALFLDRDGIVNQDYGYVHKVDDFAFVEGIFPVLRQAVEQGVPLIIVTNQSGIARGYFTAQQYAVLELYIEDVFRHERCTLTAIYHCPHGEAEDCLCRKPKPGMLLQAALEHDLDLSRSVMVGDKVSDVEAAQAAGLLAGHLAHRVEDVPAMMALALKDLLHTRC